MVLLLYLLTLAFSVLVAFKEGTVGAAAFALAAVFAVTIMYGCVLTNP